MITIITYGIVLAIMIITWQFFKKIDRVAEEFKNTAREFNIALERLNNIETKLEMLGTVKQTVQLLENQTNEARQKILDLVLRVEKIEKLN